MTFYIEIGHLKNLNGMTFEAKMSYQWEYTIWMSDTFLYDQTCLNN